ncbi:tyrosine-type recombinase/integrase [Tateyamaria sp.]|uniref:tyrosine-type recombinase/integrase n=2 Tax=Tateyamaria sp. TaxID=1929288 RepID=UPI003B20D443
MGSLTQAQIYGASPDDGKSQAVLSDGSGLYLRIGRSAKSKDYAPRYWQSRLKYQGKWVWIGIGSAYDITPDEARLKNLTLRADAAKGVNPQKPKRGVMPKAPGAITFADAVEAFLPEQLKELKTPKHIQQWENTLNTYAIEPQHGIGKIPVAQITLDDVQAVLAPIWHDKTETASRLRGRIEKVLSWATVKGLREGPNPARWKGNLEFVLSKPSKIHKAKNHDCIEWQAMPDFMADLWPRDSVAAFALKYCALTGLRSQEFLKATWDEIDGEVHSIPGARMKMGEAHLVPLSEAAQEVLDSLRGLDPVHVFPGPSGKPVSDAAVRKLLTKTMGFDGTDKPSATIHGFRATLRTWMQDHNVPWEISETALAHKVGNKASQAYTRSAVVGLRLPIMRDYAAFILSKAKATNA